MPNATTPVKVASLLGLALLLSAALAQSPHTNLTVGLALDSGGKNDRSFNQSAWEAAQRARERSERDGASVRTGHRCQGRDQPGVPSRSPKVGRTW